MDFRPLAVHERERLRSALRDNAYDDATIIINNRDTSFMDVTTEEITDAEVIFAIRSVPVHYGKV